MKPNLYQKTEGLLGNYKFIRLGILSNKERLQEIEEDIVSLSAIDYSQEKIDSSPESYVIERKLIQFEQEKKRLHRAIAKNTRKLNQLDRAITELPEEWQQIIGLRYIDGCLWEEIAEKVGYDLSTCHRKKQRAIKKLCLAIFGGEDPNGEVIGN